MTHLAIQNKINQLPLNLLAELEDYVDFLLQKHQKVQLKNRLQSSPKSLTLKSKQQISQTDIEAVCGLYQANHSVSLEEMENAIAEGAIHGSN
jgi:hypothetical protein